MMAKVSASALGAGIEQDTIFGAMRMRLGGKASSAFTLGAVVPSGGTSGPDAGLQADISAQATIGHSE
tara:strand:+ start:898 stop:1101 length:204 start_codon:yes stop_codon:yes gene_type:complete